MKKPFLLSDHSSLIPLLLIFLSLNFQSNVYTNCNQPLTCGSVTTNIKYPFWGANRPKHCGKSGFEVTCIDDVPIISMRDINFRILDMANSTTTTTPTVKVSREDYWGTLCPSKYVDTQLNFSLFTFSSGLLNVSLYYNCSSTTLGSAAVVSKICSNNDTVSYVTQTQIYSLAITCDTEILIPIFQSASEALESNSTDIRTAIDGGFNLDAVNDHTGLCNKCAESEGVCGKDENTGAFVCFCPTTSSDTTCNPTPAASSGDDGMGLKLGIGLGIAGLVILVAIVFCYFRMEMSDKFPFFRMKKNHSREIAEDFLKDHGALQVKRYNYSDVKKMTNSFKEKLGQGGYGGVFKGKLEDGNFVAVKILNRSKGDGEEFMNEVAAISRTSHVNIVSLLGFCYEGSQRALIYKYMPNGSLEKHIYDANGPQKDQHLGWEALDKIALGIARGLEYLHRGCNTRILHFDIKPHNILLDENFSPKVADFGLAKICKGNESIVSMIGARGTCGYIAPEVFSRNFGSVSHKSDVYSYGMMLSEMVGGRRNVSAEVENTSEIYFPHWIYNRLELDQELGLQNVTNEEDEVRAKKMILVSLWCIQTNPSNRPSMKQVIEMLEGSVESLQMPPKPYLSSPPKSPHHSSSMTSVSIQ